MNNIEHFKKIIENSRTTDEVKFDEIRQMLKDLAVSLCDEGLGAEVVESNGGRFTLVLWPRYRPAYRSMMLPFVQLNDAVWVLGSNQKDKKSFRTADEFRSFLDEFLGSANFMASFRLLQKQATEPVEAVLRSDTHSLLVEAPASLQERLGRASNTLDLTISLDEDDRIPDDFRPTLLLSAGLRFRIRSSRLERRQLFLEATPESLPADPESLSE